MRSRFNKHLLHVDYVQPIPCHNNCWFSVCFCIELHLLTVLFPEQVDATLEAVDLHKARLLALLDPAATVMDLNIGAALWLAAAGTGTLTYPRSPAAAMSGTAAAPSASLGAEASRHFMKPNTPANDIAGAVGKLNCSAPGSSTTSATTETKSVSAREATASPTSRSGAAEPCACSSSRPLEGCLYTSQARVVMLGHGTDEQCAGYGRHRTKFREGGRSFVLPPLFIKIPCPGMVSCMQAWSQCRCNVLGERKRSNQAPNGILSPFPSSLLAVGKILPRLISVFFFCRRLVSLT